MRFRRTPSICSYLIHFYNLFSKSTDRIEILYLTLGVINVSLSPGNDELFVVEELIGCATSFEPFAVVAVAEDAFVGIT